MADEPIAEAFFTEAYAIGCDVAVGDFVVGRRITTKYKGLGWWIPIKPTLRGCSSWPWPIWRVGSLEGLWASNYNPSCTAMVHEVRNLVVAAAERLDPGAVVDWAWENGYQGDPRSLESPMWLDLQAIATDAARAVFVENGALDIVASLEHRFWRLLDPTSPSA